MRVTPALVALPITAQAANIVMSNDDGWAELNIRQFYQALTSAGESAIISAPAENESGTGSLDEPATVLLEEGEFDSIPVGAPGYGYNASMPRFNYVNSYPVTAMKYGIQNVSDTYFGGLPSIAVAGPNVGYNLGVDTLVSGTVGATVAAVNLGVPGIAFSGDTGTQIAWTTEPVPLYSTIYADLATNVTTTLLGSGTPYLPSGIWLNVNFPAVSDTTCSNVADFKFVLSRIYTATIISGDDVETCGSDRLPTETTVTGTSGCYASISVGVASDKIDADATEQAVVLKKLSSILSCLP